MYSNGDAAADTWCGQTLIFGYGAKWNVGYARLNDLALKGFVVVQ